MSQGTAYIEENLQMDYNHLESKQCLCLAPKAIGELMCQQCLYAMAPVVRARLFGMKPGTGVASALAAAHSEMARQKRGWLG